METTKTLQELTHTDMAFLRANKEAMQICGRGVGDYISSRCLLLNGLLPQGLTLASQGTEKILKSQYKLRGGAKPLSGRGGLGHNVPAIANELKSDSSINFDLSHYNALFDRLVVNYDLRYPDNWPKHGLNRWSQSSGEIDELDTLMLHLFDNFPGPSPVNLSVAYFGTITNHLADPDQPLLSNDFKWLCQKNKSIEGNWDRIKTDCEGIIKICHSQNAT